MGTTKGNDKTDDMRRHFDRREKSPLQEVAPSAAFFFGPVPNPQEISL